MAFLGNRCKVVNMSTQTQRSFEPINWPDLEPDRIAWNLARAALGPNASLRDVASRAVDILAEMKIKGGKQ